MPFEVKIIADSISPARVRLTTMELYYPRLFIHPQLMTHRVFARNASSSRAIPILRIIEEVLRNPAMPIHWGANEPGMQASNELHGAGLVIAQEAWLKARDMAVEQAKIMAAAGAHKQIVNRILEPFSHIRVVVTATEWANFFALRRGDDAQPEMQHLANLMWDAMQASEPGLLLYDEWHTPYITDDDRAALTLEQQLKVSVARCARVSYRLHDGTPTTLEKDLELYQRLVGSHPMHASPAEHQATPDIPVVRGLKDDWLQSHLHGPFRGWKQYRKTLPGENIAHYRGVY